jgi:capsular polysaccharide biosynthesis protein
MIKKAIALSLTAMLLFAVAAPLALAITRPEYKAQVEPICKKNSEANEKILKTVRKEVKENKLKSAGAKFLKASTALKKTYNELKAVEQPVEDTAKLTKWLGYVKKESELFNSGGKALKAGNKKKAQKFVNQLDTNANKANAEVLAFSFHYCKFEPSKYT